MTTMADAAVAGLGVYSVRDAARHAGMPAATLRGWFFPAKGRRGLRTQVVVQDKARVLTFLELVEAMVVRRLRAEHGVSLQSIREAVEHAQQRYGVEHLFARADHRAVLGAAGELHLILAGESSPIQLSGAAAGQQSMQECQDLRVPGVEFGSDGLAASYTAYRFRDQCIVLHPGRTFGEPVVLENGYPAKVLWRAVQAEGGVQNAAEACGASLNAVEAAHRYCADELGLTP